MPEDIIDSESSARFSGMATFLNAPLVQDPNLLDIALIGVPFDGGVENRPGQRHAPREIRNMSSLLRPIHHVTGVNPHELCRVGDMGDIPFLQALDLEASHADIAKYITEVQDVGAVPLCAGGDHSISLPVLRAIARDRSVGMVLVDAHTDTLDEELGSRFSHGTPFRRAVEEQLLDPVRTVMTGIRGPRSSNEGLDYALESGMRVIEMEEFTELGVEAVISEARQVVGDGATYISFDIDGLDPAFAPGTGTPEIGGMTSIEAQALIRGLHGLDLVGGDVVEVSPPFDPTGNTSLVGATMMYEILCVLAEGVEHRRI